MLSLNVNFYLYLPQAVQEAFESRDEQNGQVSGAKIKELLNLFQKDILDGVDTRLRDLDLARPKEHSDLCSPHIFDVAAEGNVPTYIDGKYIAFHYALDDCRDRKFWMVPKLFAFPKCDRRSGFRYWLLGMPEYKIVNDDGTLTHHPIMPFRLFDRKLLPPKIRLSYKVNWEPIFTIMDTAIVSGNSHPTEMTSEELEMWWEAGNEILKTRVSYTFVKPRSRYWSVSTWSKAVQPSMIRKNGSEEDILALPAAGAVYTRKSRVTHKRKRIQKTLCLHAIRPPFEAASTTLSPAIAFNSPAESYEGPTEASRDTDDRSYNTADLYDSPSDDDAAVVGPLTRDEAEDLAIMADLDSTKCELKYMKGGAVDI